MNFAEIKQLVIAEYDSRNLKSSIRYKALDRFDDYLKHCAKELWEDVSNFPDDKDIMIDVYGKYLKKRLNNGESSMVNEVYRQIVKHHIRLTDYKSLWEKRKTESQAQKEAGNDKGNDR